MALCKEWSECRTSVYYSSPSPNHPPPYSTIGNFFFYFFFFFFLGGGRGGGFFFGKVQYWRILVWSQKKKKSKQSKHVNNYFLKKIPNESLNTQGQILTSITNIRYSRLLNNFFLTNIIPYPLGLDLTFSVMCALCRTDLLHNWSLARRRIVPPIYGGCIWKQYGLVLWLHYVGSWTTRRLLHGGVFVCGCQLAKLSDSQNVATGQRHRGDVGVKEV